MTEVYAPGPEPAPPRKSAIRWVGMLNTYIRISFRTWFAGVLTIFLGMGFAVGQESADLPEHNADYREQIHLQTDRDYYFSGEEVWIKVTLLDVATEKPGYISRAVYLELLNRSGYPVAQAKLPVNAASVSTSITLSDTLSNGNYLLRAYTNWMKNFPATYFGFKKVTILNPFQSPENLVKLPTARRDTFPPDTGMAVTENIGRSPVPSEGLRGTDPELQLHLTLNRTQVGPREKVEVGITATDRANRPVAADLTLSVVKAGLTGKRDNAFGGYDIYTFNDPRSSGPPGKSPSVKIQYPPELEGKLIHGKLLDYETDAPVPNTDVVFAIVGKVAKCQFNRSNASGDFYFYMKETGMHDLVIQPLLPEEQSAYVRLQPDFITAVDHPLPGRVMLDTSTLDALNNAMISYQVRKIFQPYTPSHVYTPRMQKQYSFYGDPVNSIRLSEYIPLSSVREIIKEIVPSVSIHKHQGKTSFQLYSNLYGTVLDKNPLVLVDGTPVDSVEQILEMDPATLDRIEVVNLRYLIGQRVITGIIHFVTKKGDLENIVLDPRVFRQTYPCLQAGKQFLSPDYGNGNGIPEHIPDVRNTLYWNPDLHTDADGKTTTTFYTSDEPGPYTIYIEGITKEGRTGVLTTVIHVRNISP